MEDNVHVVGIDKGTGYIVACTNCGRSDAEAFAKYYRRIGYNARIVTEEVLDYMLEQERQERKLY